MEIEEILEPTRWKIINHLAKGKSTMAEISKAVETSIANTSQHLRILEAYNYISKAKEKLGKPGKPSSYYQLDKTFFLLAGAKPGLAIKKNLSTKNETHLKILGSLSIENTDDQEEILKLMLFETEFMEKLKAISILTSTEKEVELLVLTDNLEKYRKEFTSFKGYEKKIVCWIHNETEINEGIAKEDNYYKNLIKKYKVIYDPKNSMRWKI